MKSSPIRIALIGLGAVSELYYGPALSILQENKFAKVTALYDPDRHRLSKMQAKFPSAKPLNEITRLKADSLDLAVVASPPQYHREQTISLLRQGVAVLCEKPMAVSCEAAQAMMEESGSTGALLAVSLTRRFYPALQAIKRIIAEGTLGAVKSFRFVEGNAFSWPVASTSLFSLATSGGGVLMDIGSHVMDLVIWWFGEPSSLEYEDDAMGGVEANCLITLRFNNGIFGSVRLSREYNLPSHFFIECEKGWLSWPVGEASILRWGLVDKTTAFDARVGQASNLSFAPRIRQPCQTYQQCFIQQLLNVVLAVQGKEELLVPVVEVVKSIALIEQCYKERELMAMSWLTEREQTKAKALNTNCRYA